MPHDHWLVEAIPLKYIIAQPCTRSRLDFGFWWSTRNNHRPGNAFRNGSLLKRYRPTAFHPQSNGGGPPSCATSSRDNQGTRSLDLLMKTDAPGGHCKHHTRGFERGEYLFRLEDGGKRKTVSLDWLKPFFQGSDVIRWKSEHSVRFDIH